MTKLDVLDPIPDPLDEALRYFVRHVVECLFPFGEPDAGYGENVTVTSDDGSFVRMHRFCWCDHPDCPWCSHPEEASDAAAPDFAEAGYVDDYGAPNLWLKIAGEDLRLWWYKYPGRDQNVAGIGSLEDLARIREAFDTWMDTQRGLIWRTATHTLVAEALCQLPEPLRDAIAESFALQMEAAPDKHALGAKISGLLPEMSMTGYARDQHDRIEARLAEEGVPAHHQDEDTPEELTMPLTAAVRLGWLFSKVDVAAGVAAMRRDVAEQYEDPASEPRSDEEPSTPTAADTPF